MVDKRRSGIHLHTHAYFLRLFLCLCALCICMAASLIWLYTHDMRHAIDTQLTNAQQHAGESLAATLDEFLIRLELIAEQTDALSDQELSSYLRGVEYSQSIVTRFCIYDSTTGTLIGSAGEEPFELFAHTFFPDLSSEQFASLLAAQEPLPFFGSVSGMIAFPIRTQHRTALYVLNAGALESMADTALAFPFELAALLDPSDQPLYRFKETSDHTQSFPTQSGQLFIQISLSQTHSPSFPLSSSSFAAILLLSMMLVMLMTHWLYRPVKATRAMISDTQRDELRGMDEFSAITTSLADGERLQEEMQQEALEQRSIAESRLYEKLLYGIRIPPEKLSDLPFSSAGQFQVGVASLDKVQNVNAIKSRLMDNRHLYILELYDTAHLAFISVAADTNDIMQHIHSELNAPLGVGKACDHLTGLHRSYIEAVSALGMSEGLVWFSDDAFRSHPEEDPQVSALADALLTFMQSDRERTMTVVDEIFDLLDTKEDSLLFRQHAYVRFVMPFFDRVRETYPDAHFSTEPITNATHWGSVSLKERFCQTLTEAMDSLPARKPLEHEGLLFFVEEHLFDPYFGLSDIAQKYNITEYTASRLFKEVSGVSFKKYVTNRRIERAKHLLTSSELKMSEIAQQCGFASASYFARIFRNAEDLSPAEYRQQEQPTKPQ